LFLVHSSRPHLHLPSFPTRRSSDLHHLPQPASLDRARAVRLGGCLLRAGQARSLLRLGPTFALGLLRHVGIVQGGVTAHPSHEGDRKSTRLNSSHLVISYAVFCLKK